MWRARAGATMRAMNRAEFIKRSAAAGLAVTAGPLLSASAEARPGLRYRGVGYDTGWGSGPEDLTKVLWSTAIVQDEMRAIDEQLRCSTVQVFGTDIGRLVEASTEALERGLHVWIQPRLVDRPQKEILDHLARTARQAEALRRRHRAVSLVVGCEYLLFTPGLVPGGDVLERIDNMSSGKLDWRAVQRRFAAFLRRAARVARANFDGKITYAAAVGEEVDWRLFDYVGVDYYSFHRKRSGHLEELRKLRKWKRPIVVCEFGTSAFEGAQKMEGMSWSVVDYSKPVPEIPRRIVRDEQVQADYIVDVLGAFEAAGVHSACVYVFIQTDCPWSPNPRHDIDMAGFGLVKVIRDDYFNPASPYRWEPKQAFHALAKAYGRSRAIATC
jgi:hypothetical protein